MFSSRPSSSIYYFGVGHCKQESLANAKVSARQPCWSKTDVDVKLALKVIYFAINYRQTRGSIIAYRRVILLVLSWTFPKK